MAPKRTCVVCRTVRDDTEMVRAGRDPQGHWYLGRGSGRGVWWCRDGGCGEEVRASHLARSLRRAVRDDDVAVLRSLSTSKRL